MQCNVGMTGTQPVLSWDSWHEGPPISDTRPENPPKHVNGLATTRGHATQAKHWQEKRRYSAVHAILAGGGE